MDARLRTVAVLISFVLLVSTLHAQTGVCCGAATCACTTGGTTTSCIAPDAFHPAGTCTPSPCLGACCDSATCACLPATLSGCSGSGLTFICGTCASSPCMGWCYDQLSGTCTPSTLPDCKGNWNCQGCILCNVACCDTSSGACIVTPACTCPPGSFLPLDGVCVSIPSPCGACCDNLTGACTSPDPLAGCPPGTTLFPSSSSAYVVCSCPFLFDPHAQCSVPPQRPGACCTGTTCAITLSTTCAGTFQGIATVCGQPGNPTTCCPANFDGQNGIAVQDIFDLLNTWFSGSLAADFDHDGVLSQQDIFQFIAAWFAGC